LACLGFEDILRLIGANQVCRRNVLTFFQTGTLLKSSFLIRENIAKLTTTVQLLRIRYEEQNGFKIFHVLERPDFHFQHALRYPWCSSSSFIGFEHSKQIDLVRDSYLFACSRMLECFPHAIAVVKWAVSSITEWAKLEALDVSDLYTVALCTLPIHPVNFLKTLLLPRAEMFLFCALSCTSDPNLVIANYLMDLIDVGSSGRKELNMNKHLLPILSCVEQFFNLSAVEEFLKRVIASGYYDCKVTIGRENIVMEWLTYGPFAHYRSKFQVKFIFNIAILLGFTADQLRDMNIFSIALQHGHYNIATEILYYTRPSRHEILSARNQKNQCFLEGLLVCGDSEAFKKFFLWLHKQLRITKVDFITSLFGSSSGKLISKAVIKVVRECTQIDLQPIISHCLP
jgi:hypothetical protein